MSRRIQMRVVLALGVLLCLAPALRAEDEPLTEEQKQVRLTELQREVQARFAAGEHEKAAESCRAMIAIRPDLTVAHYNLACALARLGRTEPALAALRRAAETGYSDAGHMVVDPDLASLRAEPAFAEIRKIVEETAEKAALRMYEPGEEIAGVRTVEAKVPGALRYRLRLPEDATTEKPARLVVWLHPSGGSMNRAIEALAPRLASKGFGLLVPTAKSWAGWNEVDARRLVEKTIPAAGTVKGVDARRPVLLGFSAGGQMAIQLWMEGPGRFGGLILDAAYPIDPAAYRERRIIALSPPADPAVKTVPIHVLVGDADGGSRVWREAEEPWRKAGVPLTVEYVPGGRHQWLVGETQLETILAWLAALPRPADAEKTRKTEGE